MAEEENKISGQGIDDLIIDIGTNIDEKSIARLEEFSSALSKLETILSDKFLNNIDKLSKLNLKDVKINSAAYDATKKSLVLQKEQERLKGLELKSELTRKKIKVQEVLLERQLLKLKREQQKIDGNVNANAEGASGGGAIPSEIIPPEMGGEALKDPSVKGLRKYAEGAKKLSYYFKELRKALNGGEDGQEEKKDSNLLRNIKKIVLYRTVRTALAELKKAFIDVSNTLAVFDENVNEAFSNIYNKTNQLKNAVGSAITTIIVPLTPLLIPLENALIGIANAISMISASMSNQGYYNRAIELNQDYAQSIAEVNGNLLEFDKFTTLQNNKLSAAEQFERVEIDEARTKALSILGYTLVGLTATIVAYNKAVKLSILLNAKWSKIPVLTKGFKGLASTMGLAIGGIASLAMGIISLASAWDTMSNSARGATLTLTALASVLATVIALKYLGRGQWVKALSIGAITAGIGLTVGSSLGKNTRTISDEYSLNSPSIFKMANGGMMRNTYGTMYQVGESGAELVHTSPRGTGVTNTEQFTQAMVNALVEYGGLNGGNSISPNYEIVLDGKTVGRLVEKSVFSEGVRVGHFKR